MSIDAAASAPVDSTKLDKKLKKKKKLEHADETIKSKKVKGPKHVEAGPGQSRICLDNSLCTIAK